MFIPIEIWTQIFDCVDFDEVFEVGLLGKSAFSLLKDYKKWKEWKQIDSIENLYRFIKKEVNNQFPPKKKILKGQLKFINCLNNHKKTNAREKEQQSTLDQNAILMDCFFVNPEESISKFSTYYHYPSDCLFAFSGYINYFYRKRCNLWQVDSRFISYVYNINNAIEIKNLSNNEPIVIASLVRRISYKDAEDVQKLKNKLNQQNILLRKLQERLFITRLFEENIFEPPLTRLNITNIFNILDKYVEPADLYSSLSAYVDVNIFCPLLEDEVIETIDWNNLDIDEAVFFLGVRKGKYDLNDKHIQQMIFCSSNYLQNSDSLHGICDIYPTIPILKMSFEFPEMMKNDSFFIKVVKVCYPFENPGIWSLEEKLNLACYLYLRKECDLLKKIVNYFSIPKNSLRKHITNNEIFQFLLE